MKQKLKDLTECEQRVMKAIWEMQKNGQEITMQAVTETVNAQQEKQWKTQTVSTFLARLVKKDYLSMERKGRACVYTPLVDKSEYRDTTFPAILRFFGITSQEQLLRLSSKWF